MHLASAPIPGFGVINNKVLVMAFHIYQRIYMRITSYNQTIVEINNNEHYR